MKASKEATLTAGFLLETQWIDIPYMVAFEDFTVDDEEGRPFAGIVDYVANELQANNRHFIPIIDAGIGPVESQYYIDGIEAGIFI